MIQDILGYFVRPEHLYQTWVQDMNTGVFEVQKVTDSLNQFERTIAVTNDSDDFKGLFSSSTLDLTDTALGSNLNERSKNIQALIRLFEDLDMVALQNGDVLGDAYEYLIGQFAMESGKKAGEFYTPHQVSEVMAQIVATNEDITSIYDPTVGSGSLLLTVKKHLSEEKQKSLNYYGQERNTATYNLTRMNLLLHGVRPEKMSIKNGDTLGQDWPEDPERPNEGVQFDAVVMNPPYSIKNWNRAGLKGVEVLMRVFFHVVFLKLKVPLRGQAVAGQAAFDAHQQATVERDDGPARLGNPDQIGHVAAHPGNARHLGHAAPIELDGHVIGQLRGAGAAGAGIHQRQGLGGPGIGSPIFGRLQIGIGGIAHEDSCNDEKISKPAGRPVNTAQGAIKK